MGSLWRGFVDLTHRYPLLRGMASYLVVWPMGSVIQQIAFEEKDKPFDYMRVVRFSLYGGLYVAPTLHLWIKVSSKLYSSKMNLKTAIMKSLTEQVLYAPFANLSFFTIMTFLEGRGVDDAIEEIKTKSIPTYKVGLCFWPIIQTINFSFVPERNRVAFVSVNGMLWTVFLAYMYHSDKKKKEEDELKSLMP